MNSSEILGEFYIWMKNNSTLSESTLGKYKRAVNTVSNDMIAEKVISRSLLDMTITELDLAIPLILENDSFLIKNKTGNSMYSCGLKQYRLFVLDTFETEDEKCSEIIETIKEDPKVSFTERQSLIKSRIGQGSFRESLLEKYKGKCVVTGIDIKKVLIASHIVPWSVSDNVKRLSVDNGLLLSATYDRLFDSGLITFKNNGQLVASKFVNDENRKKLDLDKKTVVDLKASYEMLHNLEYHRDVIFVK